MTKPTLKTLLQQWEFDFNSKWENPKNRNNELYEKEIERFLQMVEEWLPDYREENKYDFDYKSGWDDCVDFMKGNLK